MPIWEPDLSGAEPPIYRALADQIAADLASGKLAVGDRLPTHRDLAQRLGIARGTITRAYAEAEQRGLVHSVVGRGTFAGNGSQEYGTTAARTAKANGEIDLSLNLPLYALDPDLGTMLSSLGTETGLQQLLQYDAPGGKPHHRDAGADWLARCGLEVDTSRVLVCAGAQHALTVALTAVTQPGDIVLSEEVTYPGLFASIRALHLELRGVAMDAEGMRPDAFAEACRRPRVRAVYLMPTIQNPTAAVMSLERRQEIAQIAERHGIAILEDDIHRLQLEQAPPPISTFAPGTSYFIGGLSKVLAGGLRVAWLTGPSHMIDRLARGVHSTVWMTSPLNAEIATRWLVNGTVDRILGRKREEAAARQALAHDVLGAEHCDPHQRALHVWLRVPDSMTGTSFAREARQRGVLITPSEAFCVSGGTPPPYVRICLGAASSRLQLREGLTRIAALGRDGCRSGHAIV